MGLGQATLIVPSDRFDDLLEVARSCLRRAFVPRAAASRMHLVAEHLRRREPAQLDLFEPTHHRDRSRRIARLKREVNARVGRFALRGAATLPLVGIYRDASNEHDICDVRGKICF